ncbi:hypothetical protein J5N97_013824 [Dioscorea zingiberensis]|uniref:Uncharacterized protein n=1 Tax=Dioscorea zingiberensis TaxID=325984 RepID=A0A9D5CR93_9LILI|nr:hypothetical protein J5N97_013824 [Dioscorea zingiberensis]
MPATPDPPTWKIFPDAGGNFRWAPAGADAGSRSEYSCVNQALRPDGQPSSPLPSMADLFLKVSAELREGGGGGCVGGVPMFRTASGRSVSVRESSIQKAESVLAERDIPERGASMVQNFGAYDEGFPMFHTAGSSKSVAVRQSSIRKAAAVLEGENLEMENLKPLECDYRSNTAPMFQTGSGKSILLKKSSIKKAVSVLKNVGNFEKDLGVGNWINNGCSISNSFFQTGSGKAVNISSAGLLRAATLLGVEENHGRASSNSFVSEMNQPNSGVSTSENVDPEVWVEADLGAAGNNNVGPKGPEVCKTSDSAQPTIRFHTAGGRSISISTDALQRAKSLLGDASDGVLQGDIEANKPSDTILKDNKAFEDFSWNKENSTFVPMLPNAKMCKTNGRMPCTGRPFSSHKPGSVTSDQVNACRQVPLGLDIKDIDRPSMPKLASIGIRGSSTLNDALKTTTASRPKGEPLSDVSNTIVTENTSTNQLTSQRKRIRRRSSISTFKRPRNSRFTTPLKCNSSSHASGPFMLSPTKNRNCRNRVSSRYPFQFKQKTIKDFFGRPPFHTNLIEGLPDEVRHMSADTAEKYQFHDAFGFAVIGQGEFHAMLLQSGASSSHVTKEWVSNHYKWIVWKLASFDRCYATQASGNYLTVSNVLEELKYRYEREVNYGHRSSIKKILDGDASAASAVVLCISAIRYYSSSHNSKMDEIGESHDDNQKLDDSEEPECYRAAKIELSDGWYALEAQLDIPLSKQLISRKLFVGQKLRILGAHLCGWVAPVSPLETPGTVSLLIHINGTYRAHWADPLGFCKGLGAPLAFSCIKGAGGFQMAVLLLDQKRWKRRRSSIVEDVVSKHQDFIVNCDDSEEGAEIFKILQTAAEPEVLMADMTSDQLISFTAYQAKQEANRQTEIHKKIEKALEDKGLGAREVTPFMRVRVVGLTSKGASKKKHDLVEGQMYCVHGLMPLNFGSDIIYLQGRGSSTLWKCLAPKEYEKFEPFFTPRKPVSLSNFVVVHVGELYLSGRQKKQWLFMTDGSCSTSDSQFEEPYCCLLAVNFCAPNVNNDSSALISHNLSGNVVSFSNLVKRARDQMNHLWVAETSENSAYCVYNSPSTASHFNKTAECAQKWAKISCSTIQKLRDRVLCIIQGH